jgi:hypothetical protein
MKTLHFSIAIHAPKETVWNAMLDLESYKVWTAEFAKDSYYEGSWEKGEKIKFLSPEGGGLTSVIADNKPLEFISIKHLGYINNGIEDTESPEIKAWAPLFENYTFRTNNGVTEVQVDMDVTPDFEDCMQQSWPKALAKLKTICE